MTKPFDNYVFYDSAHYNSKQTHAEKFLAAIPKPRPPVEPMYQYTPTSLMGQLERNNFGIEEIGHAVAVLQWENAKLGYEKLDVERERNDALRQCTEVQAELADTLRQLIAAREQLIELQEKYDEVCERSGP